ncbi:MAG: hypothetical protein AAFX94_02810 [Myxococcota bacterium]
MRLCVVFKTILALGLLSCTAEEPEPPAETDWPVFEQTLRDRVLAWTSAGRLSREDGHTYTVDIAQLMTYAALREDRELYDRLRPIVLEARVDHQSEAYVKGFITWRTGKGADASGTTEALRVAEALWRGAEAFNLEADRAIALEIVDGYRRHGFVDQGIWFIRNYYNLSTRSFAMNSFLVDYDPDLTAEFAGESPELAELSARVNDLIESSVTPSGLLHELIQPELLTAMPTLRTATFSPNNCAQLSNSCTVLERSVKTHPGRARALLDFAASQERLALIYDVQSGEPKSAALAGVETLGCLARLAHRLGADARRFETDLNWYTQDFLLQEPQPRAYTASELLLTAYYRSPS